ncbi:MAG: hypothetical protein ACYCV0_11960 [Desulfitobacteriaceae bacterium]
MQRSLGKWIILFLFLALLVYLGTSSLSMPGQDVTVTGIANKYAQEVGAGEREPYINTDKGDLLLFVFALGGATAGFIMGYNWRDIFGKPTVPPKSDS